MQKRLIYFLIGFYNRKKKSNKLKYYNLRWRRKFSIPIRAFEFSFVLLFKSVSSFSVLVETKSVWQSSASIVPDSKVSKNFKY